MTPNELLDRLIGFAVAVGKLVDDLPEGRLADHISGQLIRSSTAPAPSYEEGRASESRAEYLQKLNLALKDLREAGLWLGMIERAEYVSSGRLKVLLEENQSLCETLGEFISSAKQNMSRGPASHGEPGYRGTRGTPG